MLPTFVIGLREGLEAALIVGIVAAFLKQRGRQDLLRWAFAGVAAAVALCVAAGVALDVVSRELPQRQQEGLETVIGFFAVGMVTYMVIWMRRHSRDLKGQLEGAAGHALATGSGAALVAMAFLAVLREGLETVVFLLAAFNESSDGSSAGTGAALGIAVALVLGWGIYRGGIRLNLSKFFRFTGVVLVLVAAGLVVTALHTAHEAGWLDGGQQPTVDLSGLVRAGSVQASLLTGVLGIQPRPVLIELAGWLLYLVPLGIYVAWPPGRSVRPGVIARLALTAATVAAVAAVLLAAMIPAVPDRHPVTTSGRLSAQVVSSSPSGAVLRLSLPTPADPLAGVGPLRSVPLASAGAQPAAGAQPHAGGATHVYSVYSGTVPVPVASGRPSLTYRELAVLNGGRLPLGVLVPTAGADSTVPVAYSAEDAVTVWVDGRSGRVVDARWQQTIVALARTGVGTVPVVAGTGSVGLAGNDSTAAARAALHAGAVLEHRHQLRVSAGICVVLAAVALLVGLAAVRAGWVALHRERLAETTEAPAVDLVQS
ncbi:MAG TPA: iron uptake transporter permease EfeU [Jatrophihabitantaceae bacterium]|nr:iron uptake transporter permease EfeU [Jatrophihabitantaceae bacterium]